MSNKGDYGYFGTGSSGYAHYMQAFNETSNTSSGTHSQSRPQSDTQTDSSFTEAVIVAFLVICWPVAILLLVALFVNKLISG